MELIKHVRLGDFESEVSFINPDELEELRADLHIADSHTATFLGDVKEDSLIILPPGEEHKTLDSVESILSRAVEERLDRGSVILGMGGGVVCDMTAFAASLYMRGCQLELVPTTLLAMVDASVGGKTGVDFGRYKNMIGSFYPARRVMIPLHVLESLPRREYLCGLAEAIKTALLGDETLFKLLEERREAILNRDQDLVKEIVRRSVLVKGAVVEEDLKEKGMRACLNLGHTFGHALETVTRFTEVSHGEAVAWGMAKAADAALVKGVLDKGFHARIGDILTAYGYRLNYPVEGKKIIEAMTHDKKSQGGVVRFILPTGLESHVITPLDDFLLEEILKV